MPAKKTSAVRAWGRGAAGSGLTGSECTRTSSATREGGEDGGGNRARTGDLLAASQTLSQLSYTPTERVPTCADRHGSIATGARGDNQLRPFRGCKNARAGKGRSGWR